MTKTVSLLLLVIASASAGVILWWIMATAHPLVPLPPELQRTGVAEQSAELLNIKLKHNFQTAGAELAIFGAMVVGAVGFVFSRSRAVAVRLLFVVLGMAIGAATGVLMAVTSSGLEPSIPIEWDPMVRSSLLWMAMLSELAVAAALVASIAGFRNHAVSKLWVGAILGGLLAGVLFPLIAGMVFPYENADPPVPAGTYSRIALFSLSMFMIIAMMARSGPSNVIAAKRDSEINPALE